jgi:hypothetical protein
MPAYGMVQGVYMHQAFTKLRITLWAFNINIYVGIINHKESEINMGHHTKFHGN